MSLQIEPILCRPNTMDNYAYLLTDTQTEESAIIDASEAEPIIRVCEQKNIQPKYILVTHHHEDHTNGNLSLKKKYNLQIAVPKSESSLIDGADILLSENDTFSLGKSTAKIISAPGHTNGHILYYFTEDKALFTGDVLFNLSIGGLFEGTPQQMWNSLNKIKKLPDDVCFYGGHEYTGFGLSHLSDDEDAKKYLALIQEKLGKNLPLTGIPLGLEKKCNPYLKINAEEEFYRLF